MESNRPADDDRCGGRNTMTRNASGDLTSADWHELSPEEQDELIASGWHPGPAKEAR